MGNIISNLKVRFGVDSSDFKKGLKDGDKAVQDFKSSAGNVLDDFARMFGINMSAVNDAIGTAGKSLNFLGQSFSAASKSGQALAVAMKVLKTALIATGIGAVVVGLGSLIAYFQKSGEGADRFARILSQVRSVFDNVIERIMKLGEGLFDIFSGRFQEGWEKMRTAFKDIGKEISEDWKLAGLLADAEDALEDREIALITSLEERRAKIAELRLQAKEELDDQGKKLSLLKEADALIKSVYADEIGLEKERLRLMQERINISSKDPTDDQRRALAEQEAVISALYRRQAEELKMITREKGAALKIVQEEAALEAAKVEAAKNAIKSISVENIKIPDIGKAITQSLAPVPAVFREVKESWTELSDSIESSLEQMAIDVGEFFGTLLLGQGSMDSFTEMIAASFADLATTVGKIIIKAAIAVGFVDKMLKNPSNWPLALAAGIALVAIGAAVKGALANASGGSGSASMSKTATSNEFVYDLTNKKTEQVIKVEVTGSTVIEGGQLRWVLNNETNRRSSVT